MRPLGIVVALGGLVALVLAAPALRSRVLPPGPAVTAAQDAAPSPSSPSPSSPSPAAPLAAVPPPSVRPVAPEVVAPPPVEVQTLERIDAREPLGPIGRVHVPSEGPPKETILHRPLIAQAGAFSAMGYDVVLAGVLPTPADETCVADGVSWPCGIHARTAFRNWLRGRALACVVPPAPPAGTVVARCLLGRLDAGEWLVAQGWTRPDPADDRYAEQARAAREAGRGLHGPAPAAAALLTVTVPPLTERDLTGPGVLEADPADEGASGG